MDVVIGGGVDDGGDGWKCTGCRSKDDDDDDLMALMMAMTSVMVDTSGCGSTGVVYGSRDGDGPARTVIVKATVIRTTA